MKRVLGFSTMAVLLLGAGCIVIDSDPGPEQSAKEEMEAGAAEAVHVEVRMGAGELHLEGGGTKLLDSSFRYSERLGRPKVHYELSGFRGTLTVESPGQKSVGGKMVNEWNLRLGGKVPLDVNVSVGAGKADVDLSKLPIQSAEIRMGAGEMDLNLAGNYTKDVNVQLHGGAGQAKIRLPKNVGAVVDAKGGIGSINADGLAKKDGRYYNDAYQEGKPAVRLEVRGGVGEIRLSVE